MKSHLKPLIVLLALGVTAAMSSAQSLKVGVVDMARLFDLHYKTEEKNQVFQDEQERVQVEIQRLVNEGIALQEEAKGMAEQLNNPVLSDEAKAEIQGQAQLKVQEIQLKQQEVTTLRNNSGQSLRQRIMNFRSLMMDEISQVAETVAQRQGITLLFDNSGPSLLGVPAVIYADEGFDITDEVLAEINKDRPEDAPSADAEEDTPTVSFPAE